MAEVTMKFLGSSLHLVNDMFPANKLSEIQVIQQHCGASTVCLFREMLPPNSTPLILLLFSLFFLFFTERVQTFYDKILQLNYK